MSQKWAMLQSSIQFIKEKLKSYDIFKTNTENRINNLQGKYSVLANSSSKNEKENLNGFDNLLSQSHIFINGLKKVDTNSMTNLKKLQEYFGQVMHEQTDNFLLIQQKMLGMFSQKQKILRNISLQVQNHNHSIKAVQEWIKTDHNKGNSFTIMEENLKQRLQMIQKNNQMKLNIIDEKIKYFQNLQESANNNRKKYAQEKQMMDQEIKGIRKDIRKKIDDLQQRLKQESKRKSQSLQNKIEEIYIKIEKSSHNYNELNNKSNSKYQDLQNKLNSEIKSLKELIKSMQKEYQFNQKESRSQQKQSIHQYRQSRTQKRQNNNNSKLQSKQKRYSQNYEQQRDVAFATPNTYDRNIRNQNNINIGKNQQLYSKPQSKKQIELSEKKPLPPKRNLFTTQSPPEVQQIPKDRSGGIRGLLQKSKQKEREDLSRRDNLSRQKGINRGLPPVRQDPFAKKKKNQSSKSKKQQSEQQEVVYQIDEQGYLMDQQGNYLIDENGQMIRLSPQELQQYMNEQENYQ